MSESTAPTCCNTELTQSNEQENTRGQERYTTPAVDIYETEKGLVLSADLPGSAQEKLDVKVDSNILTINAGIADNDQDQSDYQEYQLRPYYRQFKLGKSIDQEHIKAEYKHGVLKLTLPYAEEVKPRVIDIQVA